MTDETNQTESLEFEVPEPELEILEDDEDGLTGDDQAESEDADEGDEDEDGNAQEGEDSTTDEEDAEDDAPPPTADKVAEWLRSQGYKVAKTEAKEDEGEEPDLFLDPDKFLAKRDERTKAAILAELEPVLRPVAISQAEQSLERYITRVGLELDPEVSRAVKAEIQKASTADLQGAAANPATWGEVIGNVREALGTKPKAKAKEVRASITSGVTSGGPKAQSVTLTREQAAMWEDWKENVGDSQEDRRAFHAFITSQGTKPGRKK